MPPQLPDDEALRIFSSQSDDEIDSQYFSSKLGTWERVVNIPQRLYLPFKDGEEMQNGEDTAFFYIVKQNNSWGRISLTYSMWEAIASRHDIFEDHISFLQAFGCKSDHETNVRNGHAWKSDIHGASFGKLKLRNEHVVMEERQVILGHYVNVGDTPQKALETAKKPGVFDFGQSPINSSMFHGILLKTTAHEWQDYLQSLNAQLDLLDEKACFSRVGKTHSADYLVTFADCQKLQRLRKKFMLARVILRNSISLASGVRVRFKKLATATDDPTHLRTCEALEEYIELLQSYELTAATSLEYAHFTTHLLEKILEFRNNENSERNSAALREVAAETRNENETMTSLAKQSAQDSKLLKALTALATMYLPATLFATVFSSNLIEPHAIDDRIERTRFRLSDGFWIYVTLTLGVTLSTLVLFLWLSKYWAKRGGGSTHPKRPAAVSMAAAP